MDDILDRLMGVDKKKEIFDLWYEITFLRLVLNEIFILNPSLHEKMDQEKYECCRKNAQKFVSDRFPECKIKFSDPKTPEERKEYIEKCKEGVESALTKFSEQLNKGHPEDLPHVEG